jgi:predicted dehydrogenase
VYRELADEPLLGGVELAAAIEPDAGRAAEVSEKYGIPVFASVEAALAADLRLDAASVAVPTVHHHAVASQLLAAGVDCLIEKPIAGTLAEADNLIALAERGRRVLQVGHLERFNPAVVAIEPQVTRPMFFEAHRLSVFTPRSLDVDVVLDLMIHDLDIVLTFAKSAVKEVRAVGLPVLSAKVDIANVRVEFESGCVANFTASRVSTERVRKLRFFQPGQYISIDYGRQDVLVFSVGPASEGSHPNVAKGAPLGWGTQLSSRPSVNPQIAVAKPAITAEEPLLAEIRAFLLAVRERSRPVVSLEDGRRALELGLAILAEIGRHAGRVGLGESSRRGLAEQSG